MRRNFRAPWDWKLMTITGTLIVILAALLFLQPGPIPSAIIWTIIIGCAAFGVYGYSIQENELKILRLGWSTKIKLANITNVEAKPYVTMGSIRIFGIGGLFGYIGHFKNSILGRYKAYATKTKNAVLIETDKKNKIVLTPDDPDEFIKLLNKQMNNAA